jgi:hypothetical protein
VAGLFWIGLAVSTVFWFVGDWIGAKIWPDDGISSFIFAFMFAVVGGAITMAFVRMRGLRSGHYEKAKWGVRKR